MNGICWKTLRWNEHLKNWLSCAGRELFWCSYYHISRSISSSMTTYQINWSNFDLRTLKHRLSLWPICTCLCLMAVRVDFGCPFFFWCSLLTLFLVARSFSTWRHIAQGHSTFVHLQENAHLCSRALNGACAKHSVSKQTQNNSILVEIILLSPCLIFLVR